MGDWAEIEERMGDMADWVNDDTPGEEPVDADEIPYDTSEDIPTTPTRKRAKRMTQTKAKDLNLTQKLAEVSEAVSRVPKRGHNDFHNYDYAYESDILEAVRSDDGVTGETLDYPWMGWGVDPGDKGGYKAITGAEKYFLMKTFLIPTGDDPEVTTDADQALDDQSEAAPKKARRPVSSAGSVSSGTHMIQTVSEGKSGVGKTGRPWQLYTIVLNDGTMLSTFDEDHADLAAVAAKSKTPCILEIEQKGKYFNLKDIALEAEGETGPDVDGEPTMEDIPF
jgi:hypothetical protein